MTKTSQTRLPNNTGNAQPPRAPAEGDPGSLTVNISGGGSEQGRVDLDPTLKPTYLPVFHQSLNVPVWSARWSFKTPSFLRVGDFPTNELAKTSGVEPTPGPAAAAEGAEATPVPAPDMMTLIVQTTGCDHIELPSVEQRPA